MKRLMVVLSLVFGFAPTSAPLVASDWVSLALASGAIQIDTLALPLAMPALPLAMETDELDRESWPRESYGEEYYGEEYDYDYSAYAESEDVELDNNAFWSDIDMCHPRGGSPGDHDEGDGDPYGETSQNEKNGEDADDYENPYGDGYQGDETREYDNYEWQYESEYDPVDWTSTNDADGGSAASEENLPENEPYVGEFINGYYEDAQEDAEVDAVDAISDALHNALHHIKERRVGPGDGEEVGEEVGDEVDYEYHEYYGSVYDWQVGGEIRFDQTRASKAAVDTATQVNFGPQEPFYETSADGASGNGASDDGASGEEQEAPGESPLPHDGQTEEGPHDDPIEEDRPILSDWWSALKDWRAALRRVSALSGQLGSIIR